MTTAWHLGDARVIVLHENLAALAGLGLRRVVADARRDGATVPADLLALLEVLGSAERAVIERRGFAAATDSVSPVEAGGFDPGHSPRVFLPVAEVADRAGISRQAVRKAARVGRLVGHLGAGGVWTFEETAVSEWIKSRRAA